MSILTFAKDCYSNESYKSLKGTIVNSLNKTKNFKLIDAASSYSLVEELCKSSESLCLSSASAEGPQSTLVGTSVSISSATVINKQEYLCMVMVTMVN